MSTAPTNTIDSISALLNLSGSQYRIYDIGRRVDHISNEQFAEIEAAQLPYPYPIQGHAMFAVVFWQNVVAAPFLWFVKLPLDEQGLLNQGARNHFIAIIIEALGEDLSVDPSEQQDALLKKNPYHFTPAQYKLAAINSAVAQSLARPASKYYQPVKEYLTGANGWHAWQNIGVQGLTDFAYRLNDDNQSDILVSALESLPEQVLVPLCTALENIALPDALAQQLATCFTTAYQAKQSVKATALLRALASSTQLTTTQTLLDDLLDKTTLSADILIIIAGRLWPILTNPPRLLRYIELLAVTSDKALFPAVFKDLVAIPTIRPLLLQAIRSPKRSSDLSQAIGTLFQP
ncbi:Protein of unknown function [Colwellia chukchiensis]|uniref:DUF3549 domain-containing protein n=1 Tax=Colwellia chukchiensis TaxID=641665 RepID=A0A1H7K860_9GAMM|nr:DUF3549 family protein [Colwellia chukchiensis]SEK83091.1 Protein of unknown function [Colwellia chukchiensis]